MTTMKKSEFAVHIGVKPSYVTQLNKDGRLVLDSSGRVLVEESIQRIADTKDPSKIGVAARHAATRGTELPAPDSEAGNAPEAQPDGVFNGQSYQQSKAENEYYAAKQRRDEYLKNAGSLVEVVEVVSAVADSVTVLRGKLESLPDLMAPRLVGLSDEQQIRATLADYVEDALEGAARQFAQMAERD
jgi:hypothetical protein